MTKLSLLTSAVIGMTLVLTACEEAHENMDHSTHDMAKTETVQMDHNAHASSKRSASVEVSNAMVAPPFEGRTTSAGYFTMKNTGSDTRLTHVTSPISPRVEIHTHIEEDGIMKMRRIDGLDVKSGASITFKPGSYHLMMFDTVLEDTATEAALSFHFDNGEMVGLMAKVEGRGDDMDHSGH
ncbi:MAG: copper chaperone PCu(A)C [Maricaulaceae bacterium]